MVEKRLLNLYLREDVIDYFTRKANKQLEEDCEDINKINTQRRRSRLMVEVLTSCYESDEQVHDVIGHLCDFCTEPEDLG